MVSVKHVAGIAGLIATALLAAACGMSHASTTAPVAPAAPAATAQPAVAQPSLAQQYSIWAGDGTLSGLLADTSTMQADAQAGNVLAVEVDGAQLAADATTAESDPPPVDPADWQSAMQDIANAGNDAANGDFTGATTVIDAGTAYINDVHAAAQKAGVVS